MYLPNYRAYITMQEMARSYPHNNQTVLTLSISYPEVIVPDNYRAQRLIGTRIHLQVNLFCRYAYQTLFRQAVADYKYAKQNGFPFHPYEAVLNYTVTYNGHCHLSAYRDRYEYTGGAHGTTIRYADTWDLQTGALLPLNAFFDDEDGMKDFLLEHIRIDADQNMAENPYIYFDNYRDLIGRYFSAEQYYLTTSGLAVYYQQYDIAPYATGIVVFTIPYETLGWQPNCSS